MDIDYVRRMLRRSINERRCGCTAECNEQEHCCDECGMCQTVRLADGTSE